MKDIIVRNKVRVIGEGEQTLVFAHGFGCDQSMWQFITPAFENTYRLVLFDYTGSGRSNLSAYSMEKYSSFGGYVQDVIEVMESLRLTDVIFIGHSVSSMIGMHAAIKHPEYFRKLIMIGPSPCYLNDGEGYVGGFERSDITELLDMMEMNFAGWASLMAPLAMKNPEQPGLAEELERTFTAGDPVIAREFAEVTFLTDHRKELADSTVPVLIMQCSDDSIVPMEAGEYLHRHLSNSTFRLLEAKGHYPHISHPQETIALISEYLQ